MDTQIMLQTIALIVVVGLPSLGQSTSSPPHQQPCDQDSDCDISIGEVCWPLYNGCNGGVCMCHPITHTLDAVTKTCKLSRHGGESCEDGDLCLHSMVCRNNTCQCPRGEMTQENNFCLFSKHRLLGQSCVQSSTCVHNSESGYVDKGVECSSQGRCVCSSGASRGNSCVRSREAECRSNNDCQGGFICLDDRCMCPSHYQEIAHSTKCAHENAVVDLPLGAHCDEINEVRYCAIGLICRRCENERHSKCVRYSLYAGENDYLTGPASGAFRIRFQTQLLALVTCGWFLVLRR